MSAVAQMNSKRRCGAGRISVTPSASAERAREISVCSFGVAKGEGDGKGVAVCLPKRMR